MNRIRRALILFIGLPLLAPTIGAAETQSAAVAPQASGSVAAAGASAGAEVAGSPVAVVETLHASLIAAMQDKELDFDGRYAMLAPVVEESFDLEFMGSKCVGRHWKTLSPDEQQAWLEKFKRLTTSTYASRFKSFNGERFETLGEEPGARDTQIVLTKLHVPGDEDVMLNYRLMKGPAGWQVIDIYLKGTVSELALRRSDYSVTLKRDGFDGLVAAIDEKIADFRASGS